MASQFSKNSDMCALSVTTTLSESSEPGTVIEFTESTKISIINYASSIKLLLNALIFSISSSISEILCKLLSLLKLATPAFTDVS